jgi:hypothetical protein
MRKRAISEEGWVWRHEVSPPPKPARFDPTELHLDRAWRQLVLIHTSFRAAEQKEYRDLLDGVREIERLFFDHPELSSYYDEWSGGPPIRGSVEWGESTEAMEGTERTERTERSSRIRHVAAIQTQFMEDVYFALQLTRFANALDNRGWMNLFRAWGRSTTFNAHFDGLRHTFSKEFEEFYDLYIRDYPGPIEEYPVPHPWDSDKAREDPREAVQATARPGERPISVHGVFLDSGLQEAGKHPGRPHTRGVSPGAGSRGVKDETGNVGSPMDQSQSGEGGHGESKKMPPNA